jgi:hypothetical protein
MLTSVALFAALSMTPAQAGGLTLSNPRITYGELGSARPDNKLLPGDIFFLSFDIEGIKVNAEGHVKYGMEMEVLDSTNKSIFKQMPVKRDDFLPLGGTKLPARAFVSVGVDQPPGTYTCKVTVSDLTDTDKTVAKTIEQKFEVTPRGFGIVQLYTSADAEGKIPAPLVGVAGQSLFVHFAVIGFDREAVARPAEAKTGDEPKKLPTTKPGVPEPKAKLPPQKQPNIAIEMVVWGQDRQATLPKPTVKQVPDEADGLVDENVIGVPMRFLVPLNREGGFLIELKATDKISGKSTKVYLPLKVFPAGSKD